MSSVRRICTFRAPLSVLAIVMSFAVTPVSWAATIAVDTADDDTAMDGDCSLREAIQSANSNGGVPDCTDGDADGDMIVFEVDGLGTDITIELGSSLRIEDDVTINGINNSDGIAGGLFGGGQGSVTLDVLVEDSVLLVNTDGSPGSSDDVTISRLRFINADMSAGTSTGGAIINATGATGSGQLSLNGVVLDGHRAIDGGAIYNTGRLLIQSDNNGNGSVITNNTATGSGGGIFNAGSGTVTMIGGEISDNLAGRAGGGIETASDGGVSNQSGTVSAVTLDEVMLAGNTADGVATPPGNGGALHVTGAGNVTITNGSVIGNFAANEGGGLWNDKGLMRVSGTSIGGLGDAAPNGSDRAADNGNTADGPGGGALFNNGGQLEVSDAVISYNDATFPGIPMDMPAGRGGGIFNAAGGTVAIDNSEISNNTAVRAGGGIEDASDLADDVIGVAIDLNQVVLTANEVTDYTPPGSSSTPILAAPGNGGALHVTGFGDIRVANSTITENVAQSEGGGLWNGSGTMSVDNSVVGGEGAGNVSLGDDPDNGGGGLFNEGGTLILNTSTVSHNSATGTGGSGGGLFNNADGSIQVTGGEITNNLAIRAGGGIEDASGNDENAIILNGVLLAANDAEGDRTVDFSPGNGGGLHVSAADTGISGTVTIGASGGENPQDSIIRDNRAATEGGGLWNIAGQMTVSDTTISGNLAEGGASDDGGGGIFNQMGTLVLTNVNIVDNVALNGGVNDQASGGGLFTTGDSSSGTGTVTISESVIAGNSAVRAGGGIEVAGGSVNLTRVLIGGANDDMTASNSVGANPGNGGGIHIGGTGLVRLDKSTVANNFAEEGGGLWNSAAGTLNVFNSTISGNSAVDSNDSAPGTGGGGGGGVFNLGGPVNLTNVTIANNSASTVGGGIDSTVDSDSVSLVNTLVADNAADNAGNDVAGTSIDAEFTLVEAVADAGNISGSNNVTGTPITLGMLANNGGDPINGSAVLTHAIAANSPAAGAGDSGVCMNQAINNVDQRGIERMDCDIGAFEVNNVPMPVASATDTIDNNEVTVMPGDMDVSALGFTFANPSEATESIEISGFSGSVDGSGDVDADIADARVILDANDNGMVDPGETDLTDTGDASIDVNGNAGMFAVNFSPARSVAPGSSESYLIVIDIAEDTMAAMIAVPLTAGGLALLPLFTVAAGRRRRLASVMLVAAMAIGLTACGGGDGGNNPLTGGNDGGGDNGGGDNGGGGNNGGGGDNPPMVMDSDVQFSLETVTAEGATSGEAVMINGLPQDGPSILIDR